MVLNESLIICREIRSNHPFGVFYGHNPLDYTFPLILLELSFLIVVSRLVRFLLKPLRQPRVISQIIGGIILGPSVLCRSKKYCTHMFSDNADYVIKNLGVIGFMYFLFISGVKMDLTVVRNVDKKQWYIALVGIVAPLCFSAGIAFLERKSLDKATRATSSILGIASSLAITSFPVLYHIVKELNLISSEIGRMALSTSIISDVIGLNGIVIFEASKQGEHRPIAVLWYSISLIVVVASILGGLRKVLMWIIRTTPQGKPVDQFYVVAILLGVMVSGFVADMFGLAICNGPFWLGLAIPDGPPLGSILVEKSETIVMEILMPFSFMYVGMITDFSSMSGYWTHLQPLFFMVLTGYTIKTVSTLVASRLLGMTIRDSLTLSLIMSLRGEVELLLFLHWMDFRIIGQPHFTILVILSVFITAIATPLISIIYDPTRPYMVNTRRNIQHAPPNTEIHILAGIHDEENLHGLMKLLELSNPTMNSPFCIHALCLVELVGRASPVLIDHQDEEKGVDGSRSILIRNALKIFQEVRGEYMKIHTYTAITLKRSMYQDICELALNKQTCLIILSVHKRISDNLGGTKPKRRFQSVNANVLEHAPCSVAILVDKSPSQNLVSGVFRSSIHHFAVIFLGGPDAREALSYADRMAGSSRISLTVVRFLSHNNEGDDPVEKKLDDALVTCFWVKNEGNNSVVYREVVVKNGEETIAAIRAMNSEVYDLWIVGRKLGINPVLLQGLSNWSEDSELGIIGEYVDSLDFDSRASVLVVQQQVLRGQDKKAGLRTLVGNFSICID